MSQNQLLQIYDKLIEFREYIPTDFVRNPRSSRKLDYWKAAGFRQFLLYTGPVSLYGILPTPHVSAPLITFNGIKYFTD